MLKRAVSRPVQLKFVLANNADRPHHAIDWKLAVRGTRHRPLAFALAPPLANHTAFVANGVCEGELDDMGPPANGRHGLRLTAFGHPAHGTTLAAPITCEGVDVRGGRLRLDGDLPRVQADDVWLDFAVRGSSEFTFANIPDRSFVWRRLTRRPCSSTCFARP